MSLNRSTLSIRLDQTPRCPLCYSVILDDCWTLVDQFAWCIRCATLRNQPYALDVRAILMTRWFTKYTTQSQGVRCVYENPGRGLKESVNITFAKMADPADKKEREWWRGLLDHVHSLTPASQIAHHVTGEEAPLVST